MVKYQDSDILTKLEELVLLIKQDPIYKEYFKLRKKMLENKDIMNKVEKVKRLQRAYVKSAFLDDKVETEKEDILKQLEKIPLYVMYQKKEEELNELLLPIREGLNDSFQEMLK